jgi:hypothetical protein
VPASALAQADPAAAEALFERARELAAQGDFEHACMQFEESRRMAPAIGTDFNLADCYTHIGRIASAWSLFRDVEAEAKLADQMQRMQLARRRAEEIEPDLPRLRLMIEETASDLEIRRDGLAVGSAQWGSAIPVDLGDHVITAVAPGRQMWQARVSVTRVGETVLVTVPPLLGKPVANPIASPSAAVATAGASPSTPNVTMRTAGAVVGVGGAAFLIAAGVTILVAKSTYGDAAPFCDGRSCATAAAVAERNDARLLGNVATGFAVAGGVIAASGIVLWLSAPKGGTQTKSAAATWQIGVKADDFFVRRTW